MVEGKAADQLATSRPRRPVERPGLREIGLGPIRFV